MVNSPLGVVLMLREQKHLSCHDLFLLQHAYFIIYSLFLHAEWNTDVTAYRWAMPHLG